MTKEDLAFPAGTTFVMGATAGRFCSAVIVALVPRLLEVFVVDEVPNYHYVGDGEIELLGLTTTQWAEQVVARWHHFAPGKPAAVLVDEGSKFDKALKRSKLLFVKNRRRSPEARTEVTREYFNTKRVALCPWLGVLPAELYAAKWPAETTGKGDTRQEGQDYTLSALEHVLSRRPLPKKQRPTQKSTFLMRYLAEHKKPAPKRDTHMGSQ